MRLLSRVPLYVVFLPLVAGLALVVVALAAAATPVAAVAAAGAAAGRKTRLPGWVVAAAFPLGSESSPCSSSEWQ